MQDQSINFKLYKGSKVMYRQKDIVPKVGKITEYKINRSSESQFFSNQRNMP